MVTKTLALFGTLGPWEVALILLAILVLFGGRKLPELARGLGRGMREFRNELKGIKKDAEGGDDDADKLPGDSDPHRKDLPKPPKDHGPGEAG